MPKVGWVTVASCSVTALHADRAASATARMAIRLIVMIPSASVYDPAGCRAVAIASMRVGTGTPPIHLGAGSYPVPGSRGCCIRQATRQSGTHVDDCKLKRRGVAQPRSRGRRGAAVASSAERIRLSDALALATQPRGRKYAVRDATLRGIMLRVRPDGSRFWVLRLRRDGKPRRVTFGTVTADQTRAAALALLAREKRSGRTIPRRLPVQRLRVSRRSMSSVIRAQGSRPHTRRP